MHLPTVASAAARLQTTGDLLDEAGAGLPPTPDAGEVSQLMATVIAHFVGGAADLVDCLHAEGAKVGQADTGYRYQDTTGAEGISGGS